MFYEMTKAVLKPVLNGYFDITAAGLENVPSEGPVILAANHLSVLDSFCAPLVLSRRVTYVAKADYFDHWHTRIFFKALGQIPIRREGGTASEQALASALEVIERGEIFGIYPEGTRSPDGLLHKGHTGVARLALRSGVPVVPVGLTGTFEVLPKERRFPRRGAIGVTFGRGLDFSRYLGRENEKMVLRSIADEVMYEISELSGQRYSDTYVSKSSAEDTPIETLAESHIRAAEAHRAEVARSIDEQPAAS